MSEQTRTGRSHASVTAGASDLAKLDGQYPRALFVGGAGNVTIKAPDGTSVEYAAAAGTVIPVQVRAVTAATATGLVAIY
jgi:hypothetical protein